MIPTLNTDKLLVGILLSATAWATAQAATAAPSLAAPADAPAPHPAESTTALPKLPNAVESAQSPQLSRAVTKSPVGSIIYAINARRGQTRIVAAKALWHPISTVPAPDAASTEDASTEDASAGPGLPPGQAPATPDAAPVSSKPPVNKPPANKESAPSQERDILAELDADLRRTQVRLSAADAKLAAGQRQLSSFTNALQQAMLEAGPDARGLHPFVRVAKSYAGTPYIWGLASRRGFDCSGFIIRVMRDLGYPPLPHSAAVQFNYGKAIAAPLLKPGDLVFFKNTYKRGVSHVGIYLGKRRFIHAAGTGLGTIVSSLDEPKWRPGSSTSHYAGARRLVPARG